MLIKVSIRVGISEIQNVSFSLYVNDVFTVLFEYLNQSVQKEDNINTGIVYLYAFLDLSFEP